MYDAASDRSAGAAKTMSCDLSADYSAVMVNVTYRKPAHRHLTSIVLAFAEHPVRDVQAQMD